jgi:hypothetical protein
MPAIMDTTEIGLQPTDHQEREPVDARAVWDELAARARGLHCPQHFVEPWRVVVIGDSPQRYRLQIYGCCPRLQVVVTQMLKADPRINGLA